MPDDFDLNWYYDDLRLVLDDAEDEMVSKLAFWVEGTAKVDMKVDTGFMRNSTYTITPEGSRRGEAWPSGQYRNKAGERVARNLSPSEPQLKAHEAAVHCAADYAIYQEMRNGSLYRALERARAIAPGVIEAVGRERFHD